MAESATPLIVALACGTAGVIILSVWLTLASNGRRGDSYHAPTQSDHFEPWDN